MSSLNFAKTMPRKVQHCGGGLWRGSHLENLPRFSGVQKRVTIFLLISFYFYFLKFVRLQHIMMETNWIPHQNNMELCDQRDRESWNNHYSYRGAFLYVVLCLLYTHCSYLFAIVRDENMTYDYFRIFYKTLKITIRATVFLNQTFR